MSYKIRFWIILSIMSLAVIGLIWRMVDLMIIDRPFLLGQGNARSLRTVTIPAYRGMIIDRNGEPLAISTPVDSVWFDPQDFHPNQEQLTDLAKALGMSTKAINQIVIHNKNREFVYVERGVYPYIANEVKVLNIPGVYLRREFRRYYPEAEVTAQLLGFTNIDDSGQEGLELEYNNWLAGIPGKERILKDRFGRVVAKVDLLRSAKPGRNLTLSIDRRIQYLAYRDLKAAVAKYHAQSGSIIVLDVASGEILAMANQPSYNPNNRNWPDHKGFRNRTVTDVFEPGSTIKAFSVASALSSGDYTPNTIIDTRPGRMMVNRQEVRDDMNYGVLTVTGVLQKSSNVGVSKMTLSLPPDRLWGLLHAVGFGERTDTGFPGESPGVLQHYRTWQPFILATLSFGYGLDVTNLQLAQAYAVLASGGIKRPISLLKIGHPVSGQRIISARVAHEIVNMLQTVVEQGGTATRARVPGYHVSGKTGTVRMVGPQGYEPNHHVAIFVGTAPASDPKIVVSVVIKDPHPQFYGGLVAAPVFAKVMGGALRIMDIAPDNLDVSTK